MSLIQDNHGKEEDQIRNGPVLMDINVHKAGMVSLDKEKINKIIHDASKDSTFYKHQVERQKRIDDQIQAILSQMAKLTTEQKVNAQKKMDKMGEEMLETRDQSRLIVHIDMDMFFAAVEIRDNPSLEGKPVAVGSNSMLSTSNYLARKFGVRAAMPGFIAKKLCPDLVIVKHSINKYSIILI